MTIEIKEKGSEDFYRETVSVMSQYHKLIKSPEGKYEDQFAQTKTLLLASAGVFIALNVMGISWGYGATTVIAMVLTGISTVMLVLIRSRLQRMADAMMNEGGDQFLTLDEDGIELRRGKSDRVVRVSWDSIAFARVFKESICFFADEATTIIFSVDRRYEEPVLAYIAEHLPDLKLVS